MANRLTSPGKKAKEDFKEWLAGGRLAVRRITQRNIRGREGKKGRQEAFNSLHEGQ